MPSTKPDAKSRPVAQENELGRHLKLLRIKNNLTMMQTAEMTGITQGYISQIENGIYTPSGRTLAKLARAYKVPEVQLLRMAGVLQDGETLTELTFPAETPAEAEEPGDFSGLLRSGMNSLQIALTVLQQRSFVATLPSRDEVSEEALANDIELLPLYDSFLKPIKREDGETAVMPLPQHFCEGDSEAFVMCVSDSSMSPQLLLGDWVLISPAAEQKNGSIVAVNDGVQVRLRTLLRLGDKLALVPQNPEYQQEAALYDRKDRRTPLQIMGRVLRLINRAL
jgi:SOS-response transcriptional repressor LexA